MKKALKSIAVGGFFFLIPLVVLLILLEKAMKLIRPLANALTRQFELESLLGTVSLTLMSILILAGICFFFGWLIEVGLIRNWSSGLEELLFMIFPGFQRFRFQLLDDPEKPYSWQPVLLEDAPGYTVAFLTDRNIPGFKCFYIPDAPRLDAGSIKIIPEAECKTQNITMAQAMQSLRHFGRGMPVPE